jgi:hypothetical protein
MRPFSPKKEKQARNPFAPRKINEEDGSITKTKKNRTSEPDRWDGGGGSVYHSKGTVVDIDATLSSKKHVEAIKRDLKGSERERELRRVFKTFAPKKPLSNPSEVRGAQCSTDTVENFMEIDDLGLPESKAFDAKRLRQIGFDPRRRANEEVKPSDKKVEPIIGQRISMDGVLGGLNGVSKTNGKEDIDSDSDSDLDIVMTGL